MLEDFAKATAGTDKAKAYAAVNAITGNAAQHAYNATSIGKYRFTGNRIDAN